MTIDYNNGKIYKIIGPNVNDKCYVGSTTKKYLSQRMAKHNSDYNRWKKDNSIPKTMSIVLFEQYGVENCKIVLLENVNVNSKDELRMREQHYIDTLDCVNKKNAYTSDEDKAKNKKEWREASKETIAAKKKIYHEENKEVIKVKHKEYYEANKEVIAEKGKDYRDANKKTIAKRSKDWRESNKDVIKVKKGEYYEQNKEVIAVLVKRKDYRDANKETIAKRKKIYRDANKEVINSKNRKHYESNRDSILENKDKYVCQYCDYHIHDLSKMNRHKKSIRHETNLLKCITTWLKEHQK